jgi:hypothetical protein
MLPVKAIIQERLTISISNNAEAGGKDCFRTAHIPMLKAWDQVDIEVRVPLGHVHKLVS